MSKAIVPIKWEDYFALYQMAQEEHLKSSEPIPEMNSTSKNKIRYLLQVPFNKSFGKVLYWGFYKKVAVLFYLMIKNHPLSNGNKRMACYSVGLFFDINHRELNITPTRLYRLAHDVANSNSGESEKTVMLITNYLKKINKINIGYGTRITKTEYLQ